MDSMVIVSNDLAHFLVVQWKVMVLDATSKRLLDGVVKEDDILKENITSIPLNASSLAVDS